MKWLIALFLIAGSVALALYAEPALACPSHIYCSNFTQPDKIEDCHYVLQQNLHHEQEQDLLCILWNQTYGTNGLYQPPSSSINTTVSLPHHEIENGSFILAGKIITLFLVNYCFVSIGKSSLILRLCGV